VNCAAIPGELIESEILGHEKGAFTGAQGRHLGYAERAAGGALFLDEIGELPPPAQAKLLRLLQERSFFRLGGEQLVPFAARLVCASNRDLDAAVRSGRFREDLYYRINVIPVTIPPLRERAEDVLPLLRGYVRHFAETFGQPVKGLTPAAEAAALAHGWPGNVRELRNRAERAVALAEPGWLGPADLFPERQAGAPPPREDEAIGTLAAARDAAERRQIERALRHTGGQIARAAEVLGVSRTTLWEKMRRLGIGDTAAG
jgi:DNA-binding NtrC family response regulator